MESTVAISTVDEPIPWRECIKKVDAISVIWTQAPPHERPKLNTLIAEGGLDTCSV